MAGNAKVSKKKAAPVSRKPMEKWRVRLSGPGPGRVMDFEAQELVVIEGVDATSPA